LPARCSSRAKVFRHEQIGELVANKADTRRNNLQVFACAK
jgi:hypothetical protein